MFVYKTMFHSRPAAQGPRVKHHSRQAIQALAAPTAIVSSTIAGLPVRWPRTGELTEARAYAYQYADVLEVWCDTVGRARTVTSVFAAILTASGEPALLLPLGLQRSNGFSILRFLDGGVSDYNAPVVFPAAAQWTPAQMRAAWDSLRRELPPFDIAIFDKMPAVVEDLTNPLVALATHKHPDSSHTASLFAPWEKFERERLPDPADSRRCRRKLDKLGPVRIEIADTASRRLELLDAMMRMKRRRYLETRGYDIFLKSGSGEFYREATRRLGGGTVQLSALSLNGEILAVHWGYVTRDRFYYLMPAHEGGKWRSFSPGRLLNEWLLEWSIAQGLRALDFGIGDEPYKRGYCDVTVPLWDAHLPQTLKGHLFSGVSHLQDVSRKNLRNTRLGAALIAARRRWHRPPTAASAA
jgi:CelD/BcsL family acetyltransferase involved in cellulose biosynthesis